MARSEKEKMLAGGLYFANDPELTSKRHRAERLLAQFNTTDADGVTIGDRCVLGAGSILTRDAPPNTLVVGNPARTLRALA